MFQVRTPNSSPPPPTAKGPKDTVWGFRINPDQLNQHYEYVDNHFQNWSQIPYYHAI